MKQQSEHLSQAQIEQYGSSSFDAEPAAEARIEAHLEDCSVCRESFLLAQREYFASLAVRPMNAMAKPDCPGEDDLRDLAADLCAPEQAATLTQHAAHCDRCGPLLRMFTEDFSDELSQEDEALLGKLKSSSPAGQKKLAKKMVDEAASSQTGRKQRHFSFRWLLAPAATAACALVAFAVWVSQRETPERVEKLLAQAYAENRSMEMRIPHAAHGDFHQLKSGDSGSLLSSPESLRKATDKIASQLKRNPDATQWLLLEARLDLLDWRYKSALSTLEKIDADSADLRMTRALALYEKAEIEHNPQDYGEAVDLLGKNLQQSPDDPIALFNQAVACEKIYMYECATKDYEHLLRVEKDSGWAAEARDHLNRIKEKKTPGP